MTKEGMGAFLDAYMHPFYGGSAVEASDAEWREKLRLVSDLSQEEIAKFKNPAEAFLHIIADDFHQHLMEDINRTVFDMPVPKTLNFNKVRKECARMTGVAYQETCLLPTPKIPT